MSKHDALKAQWQPGQRWETMVENCTQWVPVGNGGLAQPVWDERQEYRRAAAVEPLFSESFGYSLAMRVMQSDLYLQLDAQERAECDEMIRRGQEVRDGR